MAINNNHNDACACSQCAPVPTQPLAPPPVCPEEGCVEYIESDCVISSIDASCQYTYNDPVTGLPVTIGLNIDQGVTTLSDVYEQLTTVACITSTEVITGILDIIKNNTVINNYFEEIVCEIDCEDPCDTVIEVSQAVYTNVTTTGFNINFLAQPGYQYQILINDTSTLPTTYYTWASTVPPNNANLVPIPFVLNTSQFTKYTGVPPVSSNPPTNLNSNATHQIYITAENVDGVECQTGPWTVITTANNQCAPSCAQIQLTVTQDPAITTHLAFLVNYVSGPAFPINYVANIYDSNGANLIPLNTILPIANTPAIDPNTNLYPNTSTAYDYPAITNPGNYIIQITPVCSFQPLYCIGTMVSGTINFAGAPSCAPPDIVSIVITS